MNAFELQILDWIQLHLRTSFLDAVLSRITHLGDTGIFWILLALLLIVIPRARKTGCTMAIAILVEFLVNDCIVKPLVARPRPFEVNPAVTLLISKPHGFSFPSGHSAVSFASASSLCFGKNTYGKYALLLAVIIAFSRLYLYVHYPTDVLFGTCWGICAGFLSNLIMKKLMDRFAKPSAAK